MEIDQCEDSVTNENSKDCSECDSEVSKPRTGLFSITGNYKRRKQYCKDKVDSLLENTQYGETATTTDSIETAMQAAKSIKRKRITCTTNGPATPITSSDYALHNNNNHVKNERLSPSTPDTSSRSRSVTPSSASHPDTPPASENHLLPVTGRNYSDFMRSWAAKYNNSNPNDYFSSPARVNGGGVPAAALPSTFRGGAGGFPASLLPPVAPAKEGDALGGAAAAGARLSLGPFAAAGALFPPLIDMSTTQALLAMVRTAKEAELQGLLKNAKRPSDPASPLDLSAAAVIPPPKRPRTKAPSPAQIATPLALQATPACPQATPKRSGSASPRTQDDISSWGVEDVANFVAGIDICAEYAQMFRDQRIDGSGLPMLTEEHLTTTMNMKLGPALKLRSILAKKLGSCSVCLHCSHCHNPGSSPEPANSTGNTSDSGGTS